MTELELYKYINDNNIDYRWQLNENEQEDVIIFPYTFQIDDFYKLIKSDTDFEHGVEMKLMDGYFSVYMSDICDYVGIELERVFEK
ncbi:hypothetical protein HZP32_14950 [Elizabethkingia anophelis]|nr:hypothetical protein [Elizabethkingia anophelis]